MGKGSETRSRSVKMRVSGTSLSRFELKNEGLRNELARAVLSVKMLLSGIARTRLALALWPENGRKMTVSRTAKSAKKCKMVMLRNGF